MSNLLTPLASAHAALVTEAANSPNAPALLSTARKIEATLLELVTAIPENERKTALIPAMNSGSLKLLKTIPEEARPAQPRYREQGIEHAFVLGQPASYLREAIKRGFEVSQGKRLDLLADLAKVSDRHNQLQIEALMLAGPMTIDMMCRLITRLMALPEPEARNAAPFVERFAKTCIKAEPEKFQKSFDTMLGIYDPGAAHEHLFRHIAIFAMLGAKRPAAEAFEHPEMKRLGKEITSGAGRRALKEEAGDLVQFLASGHRRPKGIIAEFERKRIPWRVPSMRSANSRW